MVNTNNEMVQKLLESRKELYAEGCEAAAAAVAKAKAKKACKSGAGTHDKG